MAFISFIIYTVILHSMRLASFCKAGHKLKAWPHSVKIVLDSKAFDLATEDQHQTASCAVAQFMSA